MDTLGTVLLIVIVVSGFMFAYWGIKRALNDNKPKRRKRTRSRR